MSHYQTAADRVYGLIYFPEPHPEGELDFYDLGQEAWAQGLPADPFTDLKVVEVVGEQPTGPEATRVIRDWTRGWKAADAKAEREGWV